jgi:hypothetical protein
MQHAVDAKFTWERRHGAGASRAPVSRTQLVRATRRYLTQRRTWEATQALDGHPAANERCVHSQNGEDGIIAAILERVGLTSGAVVEIAAGDGTENCTRALVETGRWRGVWVEGDPERARRAAAIGNPWGITTVNAFVDRDNVVALVRDSGGLAGASPDVLVIDVDGNDWYLWRALAREWKPALVVTEFNSALGPWLDWVMPYDPQHVWHQDRYHGASLRAFDRLARRWDYALIACDSHGVNAFWVRGDLASRFPAPGAVERQFAPPAYAPPSGHPWCPVRPQDCEELTDAELAAVRVLHAEFVVPPTTDGENAIAVDLENGSGRLIASSGANPVRVTARWGPAPEAAAWVEPRRGDLGAVVPSGGTATAVVLLGPQTEPFATVELVQDGVRWAHDLPDGVRRVDAST